MRLKGEWEGIPGHWLRDSQSPDGQRFIATHYGWERIRDRVKELAHGQCELNIAEDCQPRTYWLDTHHRRGRGGGKRDDRIVILGKRNLVACCRQCHGLATIETREEVFG